MNVIDKTLIEEFEETIEGLKEQNREIKGKSNEMQELNEFLSNFYNTRIDVKSMTCSAKASDMTDDGQRLADIRISAVLGEKNRKILHVDGELLSEKYCDCCGDEFKEGEEIYFVGENTALSNSFKQYCGSCVRKGIIEAKYMVGYK